MEKLAMCRICLSVKVRLQAIVNTELQEIFQKLSSLPLKTEDERPVSVCYICFTNLKKAHKLMMDCVTADSLFTKLLSGDETLEFMPVSTLSFGSIEQVNLYPETDDYKDETSTTGDPVETNTAEQKIKTEIEGEEMKPKSNSKIVIMFEDDEDYGANEISKALNVEVQKTIKNVPKKSRRKKTIYKCEICEKSYTNKTSFSRHRVQSCIKRFHCELCDSSFSQLVNLQSHIRSHTGERPYQCNTCHKAFTERGQLIAHLRIHSGDKPYKCEVCEKGFRHISDMKKHARRHTGERPFECDTCKKRFTESGDLTKHMRVHTGERPYKCAMCGHAFALKCNLVNHMRRMHCVVEMNSIIS